MFLFVQIIYICNNIITFNYRVNMNKDSNTFLYFVCMVSAMGGLLFGYDWVVIGGAKPFYELYFGIAKSPVMQGVAMTTALIGCLAGAMVAGALADRYGRKPLLTTSAVLFTVSAIGTGLFNDFTLFNIARFIGGVGIGVASALSPVYIAEVSPAPIRGRMVSLNQMTIVLGILGAQVVNMLRHFQEELGLTYLFIAHDLSMVRYVSDDVGVMYLGQLVEKCEADEIYTHPLHPYTTGLLSSIPVPNPRLAKAKEKSGLEGDLPSPIDPPAGCRFHTRCPYATERCKEETPQLKEASPGHFVACHCIHQ